MVEASWEVGVQHMKAETVQVENEPDCRQQQRAVSLGDKYLW